MKELLLKRKKAFILYLIACFLPVVNQLMGSLGFALLLGTVQLQSMSAFYKAVLAAVLIVVVSSLLQLLSRFMRIRFMRDTLLDIRIQAFEKILSESYTNFSKKSKEVYVSNLINDINIFEQHFFHRLLNVIFRGGVYAFSIIILLFMDWVFALSIFAISLVVFFITKKFEKKTVALQSDVSTLNEGFMVKTGNTFNGLEILKLNNVEEKFLSQTMEAIEKVEKKRFHYTVFTEGQRSITNVLGFGIFIGMLMYLMGQGFSGVSITKITFMLQLGNGCVWPIGQVMPMFNELKASMKIYEKITKHDDDVTRTSDGDIPFKFESSIDVHDLTFRYDDKIVINHATFSLEKGKKYLLKGASGSGKSTLIKLLSKIYEAYDGEITIDGLNYHDLSSGTFNDNVSYIYQDVFLFEDSLRNNITLFKDIDELSVMEAIRKAGLDDLISERAEGLNMLVEENGKNLSGGQRQRISIARSIIKKSEILFADEATSSLNEALGRAVEETILSLESTVVSISHRYYEGVTDRYDYVLEIKNGQLMEYPSDVYFREVVAV